MRLHIGSQTLHQFIVSLGLCDILWTAANPVNYARGLREGVKKARFLSRSG